MEFKSSGKQILTLTAALRTSKVRALKFDAAIPSKSITETTSHRE
eukprot:CAMPEP_0197460888 /NCGR_PEP_ID=MMETSP1175-20131217/55103_1 /TAXON_ID=1003142 /ORGANISM="Triceratium dubium, Strain CCMP147" /LENGTH=44 /DNA_ID= /DNA_START= /DNA_END= /DNA_ORIENTATION=